MDARRSYRESAVRGASPVRLVITLYEQVIEDLRRAVIAQENGTIEARTREINHAFMVIAQLQATLDRERGGEVAGNLARFYSLLRTCLSEAQAKQSAALLKEQISQLVTVHEAWLEVERETAVPALAPLNPPSKAASNPDPVHAAPISASGWNA